MFVLGYSCRGGVWCAPDHSRVPLQRGSRPVHRGYLVWTPTLPFAGQRAPDLGPVHVCLCVFILDGSGGPAFWARFGGPYLSCPPSRCFRCLLGPSEPGLPGFCVTARCFCFSLSLFFSCFFVLPLAPAVLWWYLSGALCFFALLEHLLLARLGSPAPFLWGFSGSFCLSALVYYWVFFLPPPPLSGFVLDACPAMCDFGFFSPTRSSGFRSSSRLFFPSACCVPCDPLCRVFCRVLWFFLVRYCALPSSADFCMLFWSAFCVV